MNNNESPLDIAEQIEVLEAAKVYLVALSCGTSCVGLCCAIESVICKEYGYLFESIHGGIHKIIPSFTFENAVLYGTDYGDASSKWFWWHREISKGGITNRLAFIDFLIEKLKNEYYEKND